MAAGPWLHTRSLGLISATLCLVRLWPYFLHHMVLLLNSEAVPLNPKTEPVSVKTEMQADGLLNDGLATQTMSRAI